MCNDFSFFSHLSRLAYFIFEPLSIYLLVVINFFPSQPKLTNKFQANLIPRDTSWLAIDLLYKLVILLMTDPLDSHAKHLQRVIVIYTAQVGFDIFL